jgi:VPDSG-CTERM motif
MKTQKKNTQRSALALIVLALALIAGVAKADTITTFDISGTFTFPSSGTFGGTLAVDVTNGTLSSVDITIPGFADFNNVDFSSPSIPFVLGIFNSPTFDEVFLHFTTTMPSSLVGFSGGTITEGTVTGFLGNVLLDNLTGTIAPAAATPDQGSTFALLGLGGSGLLSLRRRWKAA